MNAPKVAIIIVTWNSRHYIEDCLYSLERQTFKDFSVIVVDNGSNDGTVEYIRANWPTVSVLQNFKNVGFAKANNQGMKMSKAEYALVMNPDVMLDPDYLHNALKCAREHNQAGSVGGKLYRLVEEDLDPSEHSGGLKRPVKSHILDSAGLVIHKSRKVLNRGEGKKDQGEYKKQEQVFGITGACALYLKTALDEVMIKDEYFDQSFHSYKEDVDLAWRLRLYGWESWYTPSAVGYHYRSYKQSQHKNIYALVRSRKMVPKTLRSLSFKNHHLMLIKNEFGVNVFYHFPSILYQEIQWMFALVLFEPFLWKSLVALFRQMPYALIKRKIIMAHRKVEARDMRRWFTS